MTFSTMYHPLGHKYVGTLQFWCGLLKIFPYDVAEKILFTYFVGLDKEKDKHSQAQKELLVASKHRMYNNIQICYNFNGLPRSGASEDAFRENNRMFLKHIIPELIGDMHDCNCCHRHQINKPAFIRRSSKDELQLVIMTKPCAFTCEPWGGGCRCNCRAASRELARIWTYFTRQENDLFINQTRDLKLFCRPAHMPIQFGYHPEW